MRFKRVYVEISNVCNLNCDFCPESLRDLKAMSLDEFLIVVNKIKEYTNYIYLHIKGEPLLHKDFKDILDICYNNKLFVNLTTNGTLIGANINILSTHKALRQVNISLQAINPQIDTVKYFNDIKKLISCEDKPIIALRMWNVNDIEKNLFLMDFLNDITNRNFTYSDFLNNKNIKLLDNVFLSLDYEFVWPSLNNEFNSDVGFCQGLKSMIGILSDGTVVPCCLDCDGIINLGNIFKDSLFEILNSNRCMDFIKNIQNRKLIEPLCKHCSYINRFKK